MDLRTDQQTNPYGIVYILDNLTKSIFTLFAIKFSRTQIFKRILSISSLSNWPAYQLRIALTMPLNILKWWFHSQFASKSAKRMTSKLDDTDQWTNGWTNGDSVLQSCEHATKNIKKKNALKSCTYKIV